MTDIADYNRIGLVRTEGTWRSSTAGRASGNGSIRWAGDGHRMAVLRLDGKGLLVRAASFNGDVTEEIQPAAMQGADYTRFVSHLPAPAEPVEESDPFNAYRISGAWLDRFAIVTAAQLAEAKPATAGVGLQELAVLVPDDGAGAYRLQPLPGVRLGGWRIIIDQQKGMLTSCERLDAKTGLVLERVTFAQPQDWQGAALARRITVTRYAIRQGKAEEQDEMLITYEPFRAATEAELEQVRWVAAKGEKIVDMRR